eukprot:gene29176-38241_t
MQESTGSEMDVLMEVTLILLRASIQTAKKFPHNTLSSSPW